MDDLGDILSSFGLPSLTPGHRSFGGHGIVAWPHVLLAKKKNKYYTVEVAWMQKILARDLAT